jgi:Fe-S cluster assembly protein SufB/Fe-S cluster assembly protein SufD
MSQEQSWLTQLRERARRVHQAVAEEVSPLYVKHHIPVSQDLEAREWDFEPQRVESVPERFKGLEEVEEVVVLHVDGSPVLVRVPEVSTRKGVRAHSLDEALRQGCRRSRAG